MIKDLGWPSLQERRAMSRLTLMYKLQDSAWPSRWGSIGSRQQWTYNQTIDKSAPLQEHYGKQDCYRVFLFSVDCPWVEQPARPSRSAYSVETFRAQLAQEIGIAALISRSHYYYDWDDCWPLVPYIPCGSFAQSRFRFQHLSTESGDNSRRPRLGQKARVKPAVVWLLITLFYRKKKHSFFLNDNKDKKHIILFQKFIKILYTRSKI